MWTEFGGERRLRGETGTYHDVRYQVNFNRLRIFSGMQREACRYSMEHCEPLTGSPSVWVCREQIIQIRLRARASTVSLRHCSVTETYCTRDERTRIQHAFDFDEARKDVRAAWLSVRYPGVVVDCLSSS